ncbi:TauD/TfdA family dioxygenase [Actinocrinis puniceicyclus]|uniref:TauD/TfdA family dioxygenase n=1 Tax=Actinocrinis puniceicyclus TaxID=977794 RepID=A0A8J8BCB6_9ACTN|nr:TauD/TfdA family dioxygenase [Actinocrinis puniceicyclus]MBS2962946.1 TauD/TfdA family dioxygenase [Actinocrinis puniceicyclus]
MTSFLRLAAYRLDDVTRDLLGKELIERVAEHTLDSDADEAILAGIGAHALSRYLPGEILRGIQIFCASGHHCLLLRNLPGQPFPDTPVSGFARESHLGVVNALHFGLVQLLGLVPYAVDYENDGRLMRNVVPNPAAAGITSSWGADAEFSWHTDNPHLPFGAAGMDPRPYIPRFLTFYAVRNEELVPTEVVALADIVATLDESTLHELRSAHFSAGAPASNDTGALREGGRLDRTALLESAGERGQEWARFDAGTTRGLNDRARAALAVWQNALDAAEGRQFVLESRDFLIFDNYRVLHRRRAFTPGPQAGARWLRRCYAS